MGEQLARANGYLSSPFASVCACFRKSFPTLVVDFEL
jgi:hypothetical protein